MITSRLILLGNRENPSLEVVLSVITSRHYEADANGAYCLEVVLSVITSRHKLWIPYRDPGLEVVLSVITSRRSSM